MRRTKQTNTIIGTIIAVLFAQLSASGVVVALAASAPSLVISQLKITSSNGQFITLYNATNSSVDMSKYQLEYFNNYDLTKATSSRLIALTGMVAPHGYFVISDDSLTLCFQQTIDSVSLGLSSTAGMIELLGYDQSTPGSPATPVLQDYVGWSKTAAAGAQTLPTNTAAFLQRQPLDANNAPQILNPGSGSWQAVQPDATNPCKYVSSNDNTSISTGPNQLLPAIEPAATIINPSDSTATIAASLPANDTGLMTPLITEILPNPTGTGNDATDEFIELYNPNLAAFDLSNFILQIGLTTTHKYVFPVGTILPGESFVAYYSSVTKLTLSNSGSQAKLLDPAGNTLTSTAVYGKANDGQAWALANGQWYWTTKLTPGVPNIIVAPAVKTRAMAVPKASTKRVAKAAKSKTKKAKKTKATLASAQADDVTASHPIHTSALVLVAALALLYGAYEYRTDLANLVHKLRGYIKFSRDNRQ